MEDEERQEVQLERQGYGYMLKLIIFGSMFLGITLMAWLITPKDEYDED